MKTKRQIIVYIATSADGSIARADGDVDYYKQRGKTKGLFDTRVTNHVFSRKPPKRPAPGVEFGLRASRRYPDGVVRFRYGVTR